MLITRGCVGPTQREVSVMTNSRFPGLLTIGNSGKSVPGLSCPLERAGGVQGQEYRDEC